MNNVAAAVDSSKRGSVRALEWTNFFLADVQAGLGPFVAAYLAMMGWHAGSVGMALTFGGIVTVALQTPAGWIVDRFERKRLLLIAGSFVLAIGSLMFAASGKGVVVYSAMALIGVAGPFLGPTIAAVTMGIVGTRLFDRQFGRNQGFNAAGNLFDAAVIGLTSHFIGNRAIFFAVAIMVLPTILCALRIRRADIDLAQARGSAAGDSEDGHQEGMKVLLKDKVLLAFFACAFLFHFSNAAMLPQLGEVLAHGRTKDAAVFMGACISITQTVIFCSAAYVGRLANRHGRKKLLLCGYAVLPVRAVLYTVVHGVPALLAVQLLDGFANSIFGVVSILVIADRTRGTGRFNLAQGGLATAIGLGAAFSTTFGGRLMQAYGYRISFLALGGVACAAFLLLLTIVPETAHNERQPAAGQGAL